MSEVTEFLVFCSALAETPARLERLRQRSGGVVGTGILERMAAVEALALARLEVLLAGGTELPDTVEAPADGDPMDRFLAARRRLLELLDGVDQTTLHREGRLSSGRVLDPWRLAGELADHDVRSLAALRT